VSVGDYLLPEGMTLAAAGKAVAELLDVRDGRACVAELAYYDTFDGRLHEAGLTAVWEDGRLTLQELAADRVVGRTPLAKPDGRLFAGDLPNGGLRAALEKLLGPRALLPLVEIRNRERLFDVLDSERKTVARMRLQQPTLGRRRLRPRIHVASVRGYDKALLHVGHTLSTELGLQPTEVPLIDEAVTTSGSRPGGTPSKIDVALRPDQRAGLAAALVLTALLGVTEANVDGAVADLDSEFLHDLRVSVRRTRAVAAGASACVRTDRARAVSGRVPLAPAGDRRRAGSRRLPARVRSDAGPRPRVGRCGPRRASRSAEETQGRRAEEHGPGAALGADRGAPVRLVFVPGSAPGRPGSRRRGGWAADRRARGASGSPRFTGEWSVWGTRSGPRAPPPNTTSCASRARRVRYLLELFGLPLFSGDVVKPMVKSLKALQDVLGRHQDREVQAATLRSLSDSVAGAEDGSRALMAMGVLVERLEDDQLAARGQFASTFATFASKRQRKLVRETFR